MSEYQGRSITYGEVNRRANQLARVFRQLRQKEEKKKNEQESRDNMITKYIKVLGCNHSGSYARIKSEPKYFAKKLVPCPLVRQYLLESRK